METEIKGIKKMPDYTVGYYVGEGESAHFVKISGLWATKKGTGYTGKMESAHTLPAGTRLALFKVEPKISKASTKADVNVAFL